MRQNNVEEGETETDSRREDHQGAESDGAAEAGSMRSGDYHHSFSRRLLRIEHRHRRVGMHSRVCSRCECTRFCVCDHVSSRVCVCACFSVSLCISPPVCVSV